MTIPSRRLLLSLGLAVSLSPTLSVLAASPDPASKIAPWIRGRLERGQRWEFLVLLDSPGRPAADAKLAPAELYARLTASARVGHRALLEDLAVKGVTARSFYIVDAVLVSGDSGLAHSLARRADVARIVGNPRLRGPVGIDAPSEAATSEPDLLVPTVNQWNIVRVRAPAVGA